MVGRKRALELLAPMPQATRVDMAGASHTVVGDSNRLFGGLLDGFCRLVLPSGRPSNAG